MGDTRHLLHIPERKPSLHSVLMDLRIDLSSGSPATTQPQLLTLGYFC